MLRCYESQDQDKDASQATIPWMSRPCRGWPMRCHGRWRSPSPVARRWDAISKLERRVAYHDQLGHAYYTRCSAAASREGGGGQGHGAAAIPQTSRPCRGRPRRCRGRRQSPSSAARRCSANSIHLSLAALATATTATDRWYFWTRPRLQRFHPLIRTARVWFRPDGVCWDAVAVLSRLYYGTTSISFGRDDSK